MLPILDELSEANSKLEILDTLNLPLAKVKIPSNKTVIDIDNLCFKYENQSFLINNFNFTLIGPERVAIVGPNGCGKSTLLKLIAGKIMPSSGKVACKLSDIHYLDQHATLLNPELSILNNFKKINPSLSDFECRSRLAQFLFKNTMVEKPVAKLSGGEKSRALLACVLMAIEVPQLIIIDEPTNHLDLESIVVMEQSLKQYKGALLVVSHDENFLQNIGINKTIEGPFVC